jgi:hypothetical protein
MSPTSGNGSSKLQTWSARIKGGLTGPATAKGSEVRTDPGDIIPPEERKAVMSTLNPLEAKWSLAGLVLATVAGIAIPAYFIADNKVTKAGKNTIAVAPDAKLLGGLILVLCAIGFVSLWKGKRTLLTFAFFLIGFAFTIFLGPIGFAFILLGGWLMLRAWRINKYGTTNTKTIAREAAARPRGRDRKATTRSTSKATSSPDVRKPPSASKRYTPKAPPRKKIPKATE